jgi:hypothetical protein
VTIIKRKTESRNGKKTFYLQHYMRFSNGSTRNHEKKCVAYPQEDFLFMKHITSFRISLLNNCKKDFQFHIKTTVSNFFTLNIRFFLHDLFEFHIFGLS